MFEPRFAIHVTMIQQKHRSRYSKSSLNGILKHHHCLSHSIESSEALDLDDHGDSFPSPILSASEVVKFQVDHARLHLTTVCIAGGSFCVNDDEA